MVQQKAVEPVEDEVEDLIDELQPGAKLLKGQYTITRYINSGGFGITYLAKDSLDRDVVIKECFPSSVCRRSKVVVAARSRAHTAELRSVVQLFVREARNLAKIVHPNIVAVHQVFEDNGTAYMAIDYIDGLDLQQIIDGEGEALTPEHVVRITGKLLNAVGFIHDHDMLHRDISPDNVLIDKNGEPILIDFGAAREKASQSNRAMSALRVVKDGYSPQEFYIAGSEQGPWSDLYALGATLYHLISGVAPINGQARLAALAEDRADPYQPLTGRFGGYPKGFLEAIDRAMSTLPKQRLQSSRDWLAMYQGTAAAPAGVDEAVHRMVTEFGQDTAAEVAPKRPVKTADVSASAVEKDYEADARNKSMSHVIVGMGAALTLVAAGYFFFVSGGSTPDAPVVAEAAPETTAPAAAETKPADAKPADPQPAETATAAATATPAATPEPAAAPAATETKPADEAKPADEPKPADEAPAATPEPAETATAAATTAAPEPEAAPAAEAEATPKPTPKPARTAPVNAAEPEIAFAAWDVELPFAFDERTVNGKRAAMITKVPNTVDKSLAGDWLAPGVMIHSVNGMPLQTAGSITTAVLNAMAVDPDGRARVVVEYTDPQKKTRTGLLTVTAIRLLNLKNGVGVRTSVLDGEWKTVVSAVSEGSNTSLEVGDVLFRDKTTSIPLDGPNSLEKIIGDLLAAGTTETEFSIVRNNDVKEAKMALVSGGDQ